MTLEKYGTQGETNGTETACGGSPALTTSFAMQG